ncbi:hypothetical protein CPB84DRAFT_1770450, partial [Gymnopilus junonius]
HEQLELPFLLVILFCVGCAHGASPKPPRFRFRGIGSNTLARTSPSPSPSPVASVTFTGRLEVRSPQDGSVLGVVRNWATGGTISGVNSLSNGKISLFNSLTTIAPVRNQYFWRLSVHLSLSSL